MNTLAEKLENMEHNWTEMVTAVAEIIQALQDENEKLKEKLCFANDELQDAYAEIEFLRERMEVFYDG